MPFPATRLPLAAACASLLFLAAGCGASPSPGAGGPGAPVGADLTDTSAAERLNHFVLRSPGGDDIGVLVTDQAITGPNVQVSRYADASDHALRGEAFRKAVNVDVTATGVTGIYGGGPFDIKIVLAGEDIEVRGLVAGQTSAFKFGPTGLVGRSGRCSYQMRRQGADYIGTRSCARGTTMASMSFPAAFGRWSIAEMAAALTILLGAGG